MANRIYYGEYTLKYWIDLIFKGNIILPEYQRTFVWEKGEVIKLMLSLKNDFFVPPITIGFYNGQNLIIDGQQRITSLLLAFLKIYPKIENFMKSNLDSFADENDDTNDESSNDNILGWTFNEILKLGKNKDEILSKDLLEYEKLLSDKNFQKLQIDDKFFDEHYLGFSYLLPEQNQQKYFSSVFRNINANGRKLSALETRKALYFLKDGMDAFFDPSCIKNIFIEKDKKKERIDFVRYLSICSQFAKNGDVNGLLKNYGKKEEAYYTLFIDDCINENSESLFVEYDSKFFKNLEQLSNAIEILRLKNRSFTSIIDCDIYMFGLIYFLVIKGKNLIEMKKSSLLPDLESAIKSLKDNQESGEMHKKTPSALKYVRQRFLKSLEIYKEYII